MPLHFHPDLPASTPEVLVNVEAIPTLNGYKAAAGPVSAGYSALAAAPQGAALMLKLDGSVRVLAGTAGNLYEASGTSWTSQGSGYASGAAQWQFVQFGNTTLATNIATQLQTSSGTTFSTVANAPKAALMEVCQGHVLLANTDDTGTGLTTAFGAQTHRWWCSQSFNPTLTWAPSVSTQATSGLLVDTPGAITALRSVGQAVVAYKSRSMYLGTYIAPDSAVWRWTLVSSDIGAPCQGAVVRVGNGHFFVGYEDIYYFDGNVPQGIGAGVKEWFFGRLNKGLANTIKGLHDPVNALVYWFYPSGSSLTLDSCLVYNYKAQQWGHITLAVRDVTPAVSSGITYDNLATALAITTYDQLPAIPYDSPFWQQGAPAIGYFDSSNVLQMKSGAAGASSIKTGLVGDEAGVSTCTRVRPKYSVVPTTAIITPSHSMQHGATMTVEPASAINNDRFDVMQGARWHQFLLSHTGDNEILAVTPTLVPTGME